MLFETRKQKSNNLHWLYLSTKKTIEKVNTLESKQVRNTLKNWNNIQKRPQSSLLLIRIWVVPPLPFVCVTVSCQTKLLILFWRWRLSGASCSLTLVFFLFAMLILPLFPPFQSITVSVLESPATVLSMIIVHPLLKKPNLDPLSLSDYKLNSKLPEKVISSQLISFLNNNGVLTVSSLV